MKTGVLGKVYKDGEIIIRQGEPGDCMFVIQQGSVEIIKEIDGAEVLLTVLGKGDFFGEMAVFEQKVRSATARALGEAMVLTIDKKHFMRRVNEDPSQVFHLVQKMSERIREMDTELSKLRLHLQGVAR